MQPSRPRQAANLSETVHQRLNMYALAAGAAGVGVLALTQAAEAKIVYTQTHHLIGKNAHYKLDLNHDNVVDFNFANKYGCSTSYCFGHLYANPAADNGVEGAKGTRGIPYAFALKRGNRIGPKAPFSGQRMASSYGGGAMGQWVDVNHRYLGLKFRIKGKVHYGWARFNVQLLGNGIIEAVLTGYAYETIPNKPHHRREKDERLRDHWNQRVDSPSCDRCCFGQGEPRHARNG